jgi:hypothetical protein
MKTGRSHHGGSPHCYEVKAELPLGGPLGDGRAVGELLALGGPGGG